MKKLLALFLACTMVLGLASCKEQDEVEADEVVNGRHRDVDLRKRLSIRPTTLFKYSIIRIVKTIQARGKPMKTTYVS